jgi:hypothetical protein
MSDSSNTIDVTFEGGLIINVSKGLTTETDVTFGDNIINVSQEPVATIDVFGIRGPTGPKGDKGDQGDPGTGTGFMFKTDYDTNDDLIVDHAALADAVPWTGVSGKPTTFTPTAHANTHLSAGSDPIAIATSVLAGLCPAVDNTTIQIVANKLSTVALAWTAITGKPTTFPPDVTAELVARKGVASGYASLDGTGKVPTAQLPTFGVGDMTKAVYDTNADNIVDHAALADTAPWTGISGKPATFPPDGTAMLKSVYDTNANNVVDTCDSLVWGKLTGIPSSFVPSGHGSTHLDNGTDAIAVVTTTRTGLAPKLSGNAKHYLDGTGIFSFLPYDLALFSPGKPAVSALLMRFVFNRSVNTVINLVGSVASAGVAATVSTVLSIAKNGTAIGTITFAASGTVGMFNVAAAQSFVSGDVLTVTAPATQDGTLADVSVTIGGTRA